MNSVRLTPPKVAAKRVYTDERLGPTRGVKRMRRRPSTIRDVWRSSRDESSSFRNEDQERREKTVDAFSTEAEGLVRLVGAFIGSKNDRYA